MVSPQKLINALVVSIEAIAFGGSIQKADARGMECEMESTQALVLEKPTSWMNFEGHPIPCL